MFSIKNIALSLFLLSSLWAGAQTSKKQPNLIFILVDDQGYGDIGVFYQHERKKEGKPYQRTPNLDRMAAEGAMLTHQYSASPVCAPSRASLMTGVSQGHARVRDNQFDKALADNYTMPSALKALGYSTAIVGKWGLQGADLWEEDGDKWPARPRNRGFDYFLGYMRHIDGHEHYPKEGPYKGRREVWDNGEVITDKLDKTYTADLWTAAAKHWIIEHQKGSEKDTPFFLYLAYDTPHGTDEIPTQAYPEGGGLNGGVQWIGEDGHFINTASGEIDSYIHPDYANARYEDPDNPGNLIPWPETYQRYATANRRIDYAVGDLLQLLKDLGIDDNTLVVYSSDNGVSNETYLGDWQAEEEYKLPTFFSSYGPFDGIKRDTWEGGLRMPTLARWPKHIAPETVMESPSIHYDWAPTFIEAAGGITPIKMDGVSLLPSLTGMGNQENSNIYIEYFFDGKTPDYNDFKAFRRNRYRGNMQNIRLDDYMGVRYNVQSADDDFEIYKVTDDPQELNNLADQKELKVFIGDQEYSIPELQTLMKAKVLQSRLPATDIDRPYDKAMIPAEEVSKKLKQGAHWEFYKGDFLWIPKIQTLPVSEGGNTKTIGREKLKNDLRGIRYYSGYIKVPEDGKYTFYLKSNTASFLRIHDIQVIDADYGYQGGEKRQILRLKKGFHPFRLYYHQKDDRKPEINWKWKGPDFDKKDIRDNLFR